MYIYVCMYVCIQDSLMPGYNVFGDAIFFGEAMLKEDLVKSWGAAFFFPPPPFFFLPPPPFFCPPSLCLCLSVSVSVSVCVY